MIQYNLRLDKKLKNKARHLAQKDGMSENFLYNKAIEDYVRRMEQEEFIHGLLKKKVTDDRTEFLLNKIRKKGKTPLYKEDEVAL